MRLFVCALLVCASAAYAADLKITTRHTASSSYVPASTQTIYVQGTRQRVEYHFDRFTTVTIYQCDLHRIVTLDEKNKTYHVTELDEQGRPKLSWALDARFALRMTRSGNKVPVIEDVLDTGERKDFFGVSARHLVKTMRMEPQQTLCSQYKDTQQTDGWYIDAPAALRCAPQARGSFAVLTASGRNCVDELQFKHSGPKVTGIAVQETITSGTGNGESITHIEPVEISQQPLDPTLFEIPSDYSEWSVARYYWLRLKEAVARRWH